ncbi:metalloregulator ArsR/SmtB family transcription factor [Thioalkalivibrio sp. XN8]|uniref:ArsR/SmtB family transcription factor n=1 Tax=Thioalkalivibrio sp. XN8 TaxID=2712863 RepID=UPI0013E9A187|nr:metalloregulator ArsR/SmtB family transcription factor [Thioalkalivibrio sp. XN8]NGP54157.1 metalloregulator ArsR/SmtB family transcription factor [Thioalkalivibrio sp. XN8]
MISTTQTSIQPVLEAFKAVADPSRLRLLALCARGELTVTELTEVVGQSQPRVSRNLKLLCAAGLLDRFREQNWVYYRIPLGGRGAELARGLLRLVRADDPVLRLDRERLERVLARRAAQLRGQALDPGVPTPAGVDARIIDLMAGEALGELLDIGTGTGRMLRLLGVDASSAVGIDISREMLVLARANLHAAGLDHLSVRQGNMYQLRFADGSFDTVTIDQVLHQAEQPAEVLREAARVLRPGGRLLLVEYLSAADPAGRSPPGAAAISLDQLAHWCAEAGLRREALDQLPARPWPVVVSVARRPHADRAAA